MIQDIISQLFGHAPNIHDIVIAVVYNWWTKKQGWYEFWTNQNNK